MDAIRPIFKELYPVAEMIWLNSDIIYAVMVLFLITLSIYTMTNGGAEKND